MNNSNSTYSMLATHVNDLRRMWFLEHEKNKKLKIKIVEYKNLMKSIQSHMLLNESSSEDFTLTLPDYRDTSNQSTLEQSVSLSLFHPQLLKLLVSLFIKQTRDSFIQIKSSKSTKPSPQSNSKPIQARLIFLLHQTITKHETIHKLHSFKILSTPIKSNKFFKLFHLIYSIHYKSIKKNFIKFQIKALETRDSLISNTKTSLHIPSVNHSSSPIFKNYFKTKNRLEIDLRVNEEDCSSFSDSCFGGFEQARAKLLSKFDLEKNRKIIRNPKFLNFCQIFREKVLDFENFAFQGILFWYENSICYQEGVKLLVMVLRKAEKRKMMVKGWRLVRREGEEREMRGKVALGRIEKVLRNWARIGFDRVLNAWSLRKLAKSGIFRFNALAQKRMKDAFGVWKTSLKKKVFDSKLFDIYVNLYKFSQFPMKYTTRLKRDTFLNIVKMINHEISLNCIQQSTISVLTSLSKLFSVRKLFKSFELWKKFIKSFKLHPIRCKKIHKLLADCALQKISIAFRSWQYSIYSIPCYTDRNKENNYKKSLNFQSFSRIQKKSTSKLRPLNLHSNNSINNFINH